MTKRILSLLLVFALAIALLPAVSVFAAEYGLYICWEQVTDANCADILGNGVFSYNPSTKTLTISGDYTIDDNIIIMGYENEPAVDGLTVYVAKDSHLQSTNGVPVYFNNSNVTITGPGKLTVSASIESTAILLHGSTKLTMKDADLEVHGWWPIHGSTSGSASVEIINSNVYLESTMDAEPHAIGDLGALTLTDCYIVLPEDGFVQNGAVYQSDGKTYAEEVQIVPGTAPAEYNLYICDTQVTDANKADILGDGVFSFDPATNTLTVAGDCTYSASNIIQNGFHDDGLGNLTIFVAKDSHFIAGERTPVYLKNVNATITGPGKLTITADSEYTTIWAIGSSSKLTIKDADLTVDSCWWAIHGTDNPAVEIINSDVWFKSTIVDTQHAIGDLGALTLTDCALALPEDGVVESDGIHHADGTWAEEVKIVKKAVTAFNAVVPEPVVGQKPATTAKITTTPSDANVFAETVIWFYLDEETDRWINVSDDASYVFEEGKAYAVEVYVTAGEDTAFVPSVVGSINGKPTLAEFGDSYEDNQHAFATIEWDALKQELKNPFVDVKKTDYFYDAVLWAYYHDPQVTNGLDKTHFGPYATCTRGQIVTFLWRAMGEPAPTITENPFVDVKESDYYYKAVLWAYEKGVTTGTDATHFAPGDFCKREHAVAFLYRAAGKPEYTNKTNPFKDVKAGAYYYDAVLWAVEKNITKGVDAEHFGPSESCQRCQIVTFLYRFMNP